MATDAFGNYVPDTVPGTGPLPSPLAARESTTSRIDPSLLPYLEQGLQRAQQLFFTGAQPSLFPGQMYVSPSASTQAALAQQEALAKSPSLPLQAAEQAYLSTMGQVGRTASGEFLGGSPYRDALIEAATRPLTQQFGQQIMPGIASGFSKAGRYGSGAMNQALGSATEAYGRSLGDIASAVSAQDYARERQLQSQAQIQQAALAQAAPSFFQMGFLPSQALAQVGAAQEAIAAKPLQEQIQRYQFQQQLPYSQLQSYLSSVYGTPLASSQYPSMPQVQSNPIGSALGGGALGYLGGSLLTNQFGANAPLWGAGVGALLGGLL